MIAMGSNTNIGLYIHTYIHTYIFLPSFPPFFLRFMVDDMIAMGEATVTVNTDGSTSAVAPGGERAEDLVWEYVRGGLDQARLKGEDGGEGHGGAGEEGEGGGEDVKGEGGAVGGRGEDGGGKAGDARMDEKVKEKAKEEVKEGSDGGTGGGGKSVDGDEQRATFKHLVRMAFHTLAGKCVFGAEPIMWIAARA